MCALYIFSGLIVILANIVNIPEALALIIREAFHPTAVAGGVFGTIIIGLRRSVQSNEAGTGAAAIVYAAAQTKEPISQGFVALLETFLTGILCLFTSFTIVFSGILESTQIGQISGIELASRAFQSVIPFFPVILSIIAVLFAMSTLISWAYYGQKAWTFLFGEGAFKSADKKNYEKQYTTNYDPEKAAGTEMFYTKQGKVLHPNGISLAVDNIAKESPTKAELAAVENWALKFNHKNVKMGVIKSNG